ncbi:MAG: non-reducing end alpha-L-arabinofuranosidase family hydrolase [Candidatus Poribacteria bacterium]|nr:non-reducing end alpha-L-arabinofuranosidase family hydrolase [Candidatus Poribacteria bacterium]
MKRTVRRTILWIIVVSGLGATVFLPEKALGDSDVGGDHQRSERAATSFSVPKMWEYGRPLIAPEIRGANRSRAQKDPSVVFFEGRWHVFMTVKLEGKTAIEYCSFKTWDEADRSERTLLDISDSDYFGAPQVFYFRPHAKWYLIYQMGAPGANMMWVAHSTTSDIADPRSWTRAAPILDGGANDPRREGGLDYWIICDDERAYLFLTNLNGKMWRLWTNPEDFPRGFDHCELALDAKIFEASHTYKLLGMDQYLTVIEENGRRYYKAYVANRLDGEWTPLADTAEHPFAGWNNIRPAEGIEPWTDNISHGELIRAGYDETLTVDPADLRLIFQGMWYRDKSGQNYGQFQWRIGALTPVSDP